jgi:hypothetical protein
VEANPPAARILSPAQSSIANAKPGEGSYPDWKWTVLDKAT